MKSLFKILPLVIVFCISNNGYSKVEQWQIDRYFIIKYATQIQHDYTIPHDKPLEYYCDLLHEIIKDTKKLNNDVNNNLYDSNENLISRGYKTPNGIRNFFITMAFCIADRILENVPQQQKQNVRQQIINFNRKYFVESNNTNISSERYNTTLDQLYKEFINNITQPKKLN